MIFIIFYTAESFIYIPINVYIHFISKFTASETIKEEIRLFGEILLIDIYFDFLKDNYKNLIVEYIFNSKYTHYLYYKNNKIYFTSILLKILKNKYINNKIKKIKF